MTTFRKFREMSGLSQKELALLIGVSPVAISHLENRNRTPSLKTARKIISEFNARGCNTNIDIVFPAESTVIVDAA